MKLEDQYTTLAHSKKLKDLGLDQKTAWFWCYPVHEKLISSKTSIIHASVTSDYLDDNEGDEFDHTIASAYSVAELGVMIGKGTKMAEDFHNAIDKKVNGGNSITVCFDPKFVADFIIDYLETGACHVEPINERLTK